MQIAKKEGSKYVVMSHVEAFPNTSFPLDVTIDMLPGCFEVNAFIEHDSETERLESIDPTLGKDGKVYVVKVVKLTSEEIASRNKAISPRSVSMRQARLALLNAGLLESITDAVGSMDAAAQIEWEYGTEVLRTAKLLDIVKEQMGMTDAQIDELFIVASKL